MTQQDLEAVLTVSETRVEYASRVSRALGRDVFVKRDDATHPVYGGNKVRKLARVFAEARARGATDVVTVGAVGSNQVLAAIVHGRALGLRVHAVLVPQPYQWVAERNLRADVAQGGRLIPVPDARRAPWVIAREVMRLRASGARVAFVTLGASSTTGTLGYVDAMRELAVQVARGDLPRWPSWNVVALGSGGTHAGLVAGARVLRAPTRVLGVKVTDAWAVSRASVAWLAKGASGTWRTDDVHVDADQLGAGYGVLTDNARHAMDLFGEDGVVLEGTYTAKAAAGVIALAKRESTGPIVFWHTWSSAPMGPLLEGAEHTRPSAALMGLLR